jgi:hypothetical protein
MSIKQYDIFLDDKIIGTTELENADAPMGVVFGNITFENIISGYDFFKSYCLKNNIKIFSDYPDDKYIVTADIPNLKVLNPKGSEIKGLGTYIEGSDTIIFRVSIVGIPYPFYEEEFPHHRKAYDNQFKNKQ